MSNYLELMFAQKIKMNLFKRRKILVTHPGTFHTDDLFATAVLDILHDGHIKIIRTSEKEYIDKADYVYDIGGVYNKEKNKFDHHQKDGPIRDSGIPYASLGLVWEKFGKEICGNEEVAKLIEKKIILPIDAEDNGVDLFKTNYEGIFPYAVGDIFKSEIPTWTENADGVDKIFEKQVQKVVVLLRREIKIAKDDLDGIKVIKNAYDNSEDKRIVKLNFNLPRYLYQDTLANLRDPLYVIMPDRRDGKWKVEAIRQDLNTKASRKPFPESWRGETDIEKLKEVSGVDDIIFCHRNGFLAGVKTLEGAIALAQKSLLS